MVLKKQTETRWFTAVVIFLFVYCGLLFFFRSVLLKLETGNGSVLKPEPGQILAVGFLILVYHLSYLGLYAFSALGNRQKAMASFLAVVINLTLLYGFKLWFDAISENPFLSLTDRKLPWYAEEKTKFLLSNGPLLLFFIIVFAFRLIAIAQRRFSEAGTAA